MNTIRVVKVIFPIDTPDVLILIILMLALHNTYSNSPPFLLPGASFTHHGS